MQLTWALYIIGLSLLVGTAARWIELLCRHFGWPTRGVWVASLVVSTGFPLLPLLAPNTFTDLLLQWLHLWGDDGHPLTRLVGLLREGQWMMVQDLPDLQTLLLITWGIALVAAGCWLLYSFRVLKRRQGRWTEAQVGDRECLLSRETGPAIVGVFRHRLVVPEWILDLAPNQREMILTHEEEHLQKRDPWLLGLAYSTLLVFPWNPVIWWQVRRLRLAVELDCDRRVTAAGKDPASYSKLLLDIARNDGLSPTTAFARGESHTGERIREIMDPTQLGAGQLAVRSVGALLLVGCMLTIPQPILPYRGEGAPKHGGEVGPTPFTEAPECLNCVEVSRAIERRLDHVGRHPDDDNPVLVSIQLLETGEIGYTTVPEYEWETEPEVVRDIARRLAHRLRFEPARLHGELTTVWMTLEVPYRDGS